MGSVIYRKRFSDKSIAWIIVFAMYFVGAITFLYFGLQPSVSSKDVYAAEAATSDGTLEIPTIDFSSPTTTVHLNGKNLEVPEQIVGSYSVHDNKTLLIGHSSTAFKNLAQISLGQKILYHDKTYLVSNIDTREKSDISMKTILKAEEKDTIILMTCTGEQISGNDYTHRLIVTAVEETAK